LATADSVAYADTTGTKPPSDADKTQDALEASTTMGAGTLHLNGTTANIAIGTATTWASNGIQLQYNSGTPRAHIGSATNYVRYDGTNLIIATNAIGAGASIGANSVAFGSGADASGDNSVAIGTNASSFEQSTSIGYAAETTGLYGVAIGVNSQAASSGVSLGWWAESGLLGTALGRGTKSLGSGGTAVGQGAVSGEYSVSVGYSAKTANDSGYNNFNANSAIAIGADAEASKNFSVAIGHNASANAEGAFFIGNDGSNQTANSISLGNDNYTVTVNGFLKLVREVTPFSTNLRAAGSYGIYDSYKTGHVWGMGAAYKISNNGSDFGNLYGIAYKHTNNTTGGTMAGGHQIVYCANGAPKAAISLSSGNIWSEGTITSGGAIYEAGTSLSAKYGPITRTYIEVGAYAFLKSTSGGSPAYTNQSYAGSTLRFSDANNGNGGVVSVGTWMCCGYGTYKDRATLYQRIA